MGCFIYFWIHDVKPTSCHSYSSELFAVVTPVRMQHHSQHLVLPFQPGTFFCLSRSILWVVLDFRWVSDLRKILKFLFRMWLQCQGHLALLVMEASFWFPVLFVGICTHNLSLKSWDYPFIFYVYSIPKILLLQCMALLLWTLHQPGFAPSCLSHHGRCLSLLLT